MSQPRPSRGAYVAFGALWFMRLGILGMLAVILAVLWQRYHLSDDQQELARYVEVEVPVLLRAEQPVLQRVADLLDGDFQPMSDQRASAIRFAAERRLRENMALLQVAQNAADIGVWSWEIDSGKLDWDERLMAWYEVPEAVRASGLFYAFWTQRVHPDDAARLACYDAAAGRAAPTRAAPPVPAAAVSAPAV